MPLPSHEHHGTGSWELNPNQASAAMKAWCVFDVSPVDGVLLVFAATRNRARALACNQALWDWEYVGTSAIRKQKWDSFFDAERVIETNDDLPAGAPEFYDDWEL